MSPVDGREAEMERTAPPAAATKPFKCAQCGAQLLFAPGTRSLKCEYCAFANTIPQSEEDIKELDFAAFARQSGALEEVEERLTVKCDACGAESTLKPNVTSQRCPFCDMNIVAAAVSKKIIKPKSLLPFKVTDREAKDGYRKWIARLWFAPGELKKRATLDVAVTGMYLPFWTYDASTTSFYTGERGVYYYVTETRRTTNSEGKSVEERVEVRKTRWSVAMGTVWESFDDVLIPATRSLPEKLARALEPWDLPNLVPYRDEYLSGYLAESYQVDLAQGFEEAKAIMDGAIRAAVCRDIGGDEQRILAVKTRHDGVTFKHVLLPVWLSAYRYKNKVYRFMVNARTGEVQGERPWSATKITLLILAILAVILVIASMNGVLH